VIFTACAIQGVIDIGSRESFAPEMPEFPARRLVILTSADGAALDYRVCY
jgi:hypothetical protein